MPQQPRSVSSAKRRTAHLRPEPKHVALIVEAAVAPRRMLLTGVARYIQEHAPWLIYLKPAGVEQNLSSWLQDWGGDGIIVSANDPDNSVVPRPGLSIIDLFGSMRERKVPMVHVDDLAVGRMGAEHLLAHGFRHFGFWRYIDKDTAWSVRRCDGFQQALPPGATCEVYETHFPKPGSGGPRTWEQQQHGLVGWLSGLPKPIGIMTSTDLMGQQLLEACRRAQFTVPETIAVIGVDNDEPICRISNPPLTSVILNDHQRGYEAAALLDRLMAGGSSAHRAYLDSTRRRGLPRFHGIYGNRRPVDCQSAEVPAGQRLLQHQRRRRGQGSLPVAQRARAPLSQDCQQDDRRRDCSPSGQPCHRTVKQHVDGTEGDCLQFWIRVPGVYEFRFYEKVGENTRFLPRPSPVRIAPPLLKLQPYPD